MHDFVHRIQGTLCVADGHVLRFVNTNGTHTSNAMTRCEGKNFSELRQIGLIKKTILYCCVHKKMKGASLNVITDNVISLIIESLLVFSLQVQLMAIACSIEKGIRLILSFTYDLM